MFDRLARHELIFTDNLSEELIGRFEKEGNSFLLTRLKMGEKQTVLSKKLLAIGH